MQFNRIGYIFILILLFGFHGRNSVNAQKLIEVRRYWNYLDSDSFKYDGDCSINACSSAGGYQVDSSCSCKCNNNRAFSTADNRCIQPRQDDLFVLGYAEMLGPRISKLASFELRSGVTIKYCLWRQFCETVFQSCTLNKENSVYDNMAWEQVWPTGYEVGLEIVSKDGLQKLQLKDTFNSRLSGKLLRLNIDCIRNGRKINGYAMASFPGIYTEKEILENRTDAVTKDKTMNQTQTKDQNESSSSKTGIAIGITILALLLLIACVLIHLYFKWKKDKVKFLISFHENKVVRWVTVKWAIFKRKTGEPTFYVDPQTQNEKKETNQTTEIPDILKNAVDDLEANKVQQDYGLPHGNREKNRGTIGKKLGNLYTTSNKYVHKKHGYSNKKERKRSFSAFSKELYNEPGSVIPREDEPVTNKIFPKEEYDQPGDVINGNIEKQEEQKQEQNEKIEEIQQEETQQSCDENKVKEQPNKNETVTENKQENNDDHNDNEKIIYRYNRPKTLLFKEPKERPESTYSCPVGYVFMHSPISIDLPSPTDSVPISPSYSSINCFMTELENSPYLIPYPELAEPIEEPLYYSADEAPISSSYIEDNEYLQPNEIQTSSLKEEPIYLNPNQNLNLQNKNFEKEDHIYTNPDEKNNNKDNVSEDPEYSEPIEETNEETLEKQFKSHTNSSQKKNLYIEVTLSGDVDVDHPYKNSDNTTSPIKYIIPEVKRRRNTLEF